MRKTILLFLIMLLYFIVCNFCMAQEKNSKNRELTIYMRVKDHLTHDDIDSTLTARLLLAKDSSFVDSAKIAKTNYQGQRFTYAQAVLKDAGIDTHFVRECGCFEEFLLELIQSSDTGHRCVNMVACNVYVFSLK